MNKIKKLCLMTLSLFSLPLISLTSCTGGFFKSDVVMIEDIIATTLSDGNIRLTITFTDDSHEPVSVTIPQGKTGNGIESIQQELSADGTYTTVTITYTDDNMDPVSFDIANGVSISSIEQLLDEDGNILIDEDGNSTLQIKLSNGEILTFDIPKGDPGKDGTSISGVTSTIDEETGDIVLTITYSDPLQEPSIIRIPAPSNGANGNNLESITFTQEDGMYQITFTLFNGVEETRTTVQFPVPASWYSGSGAPNISGVEGDLYFNESNYTIYKYSNGRWVLIADLDNSGLTDTHSVSFNLNAEGDESAKFISQDDSLVQTAFEDIPNGRYFACLDYKMPLASRDNYEFMGWYTSPTYDNPTIGMFTDTTPIYQDMILYAHWEAI